MQNVTRRQHFVPVSYIKAWASDPNVEGQDFLIDRIDKRTKEKQTVPAKSFLYEDWLYEDNNLPVNTVEKFLGFGEGELPIIRQAIALGGNVEKKHIEQLARYVALLWLRNPELWRQSETGKQVINFSVLEDGVVKELTIHEMISNGAFDSEERANPVVAAMILGFEPLVLQLQKMRMSVDIARSSRFITTDRPVRRHLQIPTPWMPGPELVFPLSPNFLLRWTDRRRLPARKFVDEFDVFLANWSLANWADRWIIYSGDLDPDLLCPEIDITDVLRKRGAAPSGLDQILTYQRAKEILR